jgi:CBS domain-containing protein
MPDKSSESAAIESSDVGDAEWRHLASSELLQAQDVMTRNPVSVHPTHSMRALVSILLANGLDRVPVLDRAGHPLGVVGVSDVLKALAHGISRPGLAHHPLQPRDRPPVHEPVLQSIRFLDTSGDGLAVSDLLQPSPDLVRPETPLLELAALLMKDENDQVFVVEGRHLVGVIKRADVMRILCPRSRSGWRSVHKLGESTRT